MTSKTDLLNGTTSSTTSSTSSSGMATIQPVARAPVKYAASGSSTTEWLNSVLSRIINSTAAGAARQLTMIADRAPIPLVYGLDRVGAMVLNVVPHTSVGVDFVMVQCLWGHACDSMPNEPTAITYNDEPLPAGSLHAFYNGYGVDSVWATFVSAMAAQGVTYTDTLAGFAVSYIAIPVTQFSGALRFEAVLKGRKVYDPRKDSTAGGSGTHRLATPSTWEWSDNPTLCAADFLYSTEYGCDKAVDYSTVGAAADTNDALVSGEKRRTLNVMLNSMQSARAVAETLRAYAGCFYFPGSSGIKFIPDRPDSSIATYTHASGQIAAIRVSKKDSGNFPTECEVRYTNKTVTPWKEDSVFEAVSGIDVTIPRRLTSVSMPGINRHSQAKREALERLAKLRSADLSVTVDVFDIGIAHEVGDIITVTHPVGLSSQLLRVGDIEALPNAVWRMSCVKYDATAYSDDVTTGPTYDDVGFMNSSVVLGEFVSVKDFGAVGDGTTDDTTAIQDALDASLVVHFGNRSANYKVTDAITLRSGHILDGRGATITQTTADTEIFNAESKSNIVISGINFVGKGDDYINSDSARAVAVYGGTAGSAIHVRNNTFTGFCYAAVRFQAQDDCTFVDNVVVGPGSAELTAITDSRCYGVLFDSGCNRCLVSGNSITAVAQGIVMETCTEMAITANRIFSNVGQHGMYVGAGTRNVTITGNIVYDIDLTGIKVQAQDYAGVSNIGIVISGNIVSSTGDQGIFVCNSTGGATYKCIDVTIAGNTIRSAAGAAINVDNSINVVVNGNAIDAPGQAGIMLDESSQVLVMNNSILNTAYSGIRDSAACNYVAIKNNVIKDCATANSAGDEYGIFIQATGSSEYTITGNHITDSLANMQYGIYIAADMNSTLVLNDNVVTNATAYGLNLGSTGYMRSFRGNLLSGTSGAAASNPTLPTVASGSTIALSTAHDVFSITGTTNITSITASGHSGHTVTLKFLGALTVTDGSNLTLAGNFTTAESATLTLISDGTNWYEVARSTN